MSPPSPIPIPMATSVHEKNRKILNHFRGQLNAQDLQPNTFKVVVEKITKWINDERAHYPEARLDILMTVMAARDAASRILQPGHLVESLNAYLFLGNETAELYVKLVNVLLKYRYLYVEPELQNHIGTQLFPSVSTYNAAYNPSVSPSPSVRRSSLVSDGQSSRPVTASPQTTAVPLAMTVPKARHSSAGSVSVPSTSTRPAERSSLPNVAFPSTSISAPCVAPSDTLLQQVPPQPAPVPVPVSVPVPVHPTKAPSSQSSTPSNNKPPSSSMSTSKSGSKVNLAALLARDRKARAQGARQASGGSSVAESNARPSHRAVSGETTPLPAKQSASTAVSVKKAFDIMMKKAPSGADVAATASDQIPKENGAGKAKTSLPDTPHTELPVSPNISVSALPSLPSLPSLPQKLAEVPASALGEDAPQNSALEPDLPASSLPTAQKDATSLTQDANDIAMNDVHEASEQSSREADVAQDIEMTTDADASREADEVMQDLLPSPAQASPSPNVAPTLPSTSSTTTAVAKSTTEQGNTGLSDTPMAVDSIAHPKAQEAAAPQAQLETLRRTPPQATSSRLKSGTTSNGATRMEVDAQPSASAPAPSTSRPLPRPALPFLSSSVSNINGSSKSLPGRGTNPSSSPLTIKIPARPPKPPKPPKPISIRTYINELFNPNGVGKYLPTFPDDTAVKAKFDVPDGPELSVPCSFSLTQEEYDRVQRWLKPPDSESDISDSLVLTLGCYQRADVLTKLNQHGATDLKDGRIDGVLNQLGVPCSWPADGKTHLALKTSYKGEEARIPLSPPMNVTDDGLYDVSLLGVSGDNSFKIQFSYHSLIDEMPQNHAFVFVWRLHPPTPAMLEQVAKTIQKKKERKERMAKLLSSDNFKFTLPQPPPSALASH